MDTRQPTSEQVNEDVDRAVDETRPDEEMSGNVPPADDALAQAHETVEEERDAYEAAKRKLLGALKELRRQVRGQKLSPAERVDAVDAFVDRFRDQEAAKLLKREYADVQLAGAPEFKQKLAKMAKIVIDMSAFSRENAAFRLRQIDQQVLEGFAKDEAQQFKDILRELESDEEDELERAA